LLLRHQPHIVHFSGHGSTQGEIVLEDAKGRPVTAPAAVLSDLFRILKDNVRCVILNACWSQTQAEGIAAEIDCVIGMAREIDDDDALSFAGGFYRALGYGRSVAEAFDLGRNELALSEMNSPSAIFLPLRRHI